MRTTFSTSLFYRTCLRPVAPGVDWIAAQRIRCWYVPAQVDQRSERAKCLGPRALPHAGQVSCRLADSGQVRSRCGYMAEFAFASSAPGIELKIGVRQLSRAKILDGVAKARPALLHGFQHSLKSETSKTRRKHMLEKQETKEATCKVLILSGGRARTRTVDLLRVKQWFHPKLLTSLAANAAQNRFRRAGGRLTQRKRSELEGAIRSTRRRPQMGLKMRLFAPARSDGECPTLRPAALQPVRLIGTNARRTGP